MAKPVRHGDKWRIRWTDARGRRQSAVFDEFRTAQVELGRHLTESADVRRGLLASIEPDKTCNDCGHSCGRDGNAATTSSLSALGEATEGLSHESSSTGTGG